MSKLHVSICTYQGPKKGNSKHMVLELEEKNEKKHWEQETWRTFDFAPENGWWMTPGQKQSYQSVNIELLRRLVYPTASPFIETLLRRQVHKIISLSIFDQEASTAIFLRIFEFVNPTENQNCGRNIITIFSMQSVTAGRLNTKRIVFL